MRFKRGNKTAKGGKRRGAGRPTKQQQKAKETLRQAVDREMAHNAAILAKAYIRSAKKNPATLRHVIDKVLPPVQKIEHSGNVIFETPLGVEE